MFDDSKFARDILEIRNWALKSIAQEQLILFQLMVSPLMCSAKPSDHHSYKKAKR